MNREWLLACPAAHRWSGLTFSPICVLLLATSLTACAPIWPTLKNESALKLKVDDTKEHVCVRPSAGDAIPYDCIEAARNELVDLENRAGYFERAIAYTAVAGGTYAGYEASRTNANHSLLKHAAIGIAALAGFAQVVGADQQITAVDAGIDALDCVRKAADAINNEDLNSFHTLSTNFHARYATPMVVTGFTTEELSGINRMSQLRLMDFDQRAQAFTTAIANAKKTASIDVYNAVLSIREEVRRQIATKSVDATAVYKAQQSAVNSMVGDIAQKSGDQQQATLRLQLVSPGSQPADTPTTTPGKASQDAFHSCVAPATGSS